MTSPEDGPTGKTTESRHQLPDDLPDPNSNPAGTSSAPSAEDDQKHCSIRTAGGHLSSKQQAIILR